MMSIQKALFGHFGEQEVCIYTLASDNLKVSVIEYGARIQSVYTKDKNQNGTNVVLGRNTLEEYTSDGFFLGAVCGRHANRIGDAQIQINNVTYKMEKNEGDNSLHSGSHGFHNRIFSGEIVGDTVELSLISPHLDQGFPGVMDLKIIYSITRENGLLIEYMALCNMDTVCNLTNHSYFNLEGDDGTILDHTIMMAADFYTPLKSGSLPDGEIRSVKGTPFDFTSARRIGDSISEKDSLVSDGYDHNFVLRGPSSQPAAILCAPRSGICMQVFTTLPGMQFYTGNHLNGYFTPDDLSTGRHHALCLETQFFPNAFAYSHFVQPVIKAGDPYMSTTEYRFHIQ